MLWRKIVGYKDEGAGGKGWQNWKNISIQPHPTSFLISFVRRVLCKNALSSTSFLLSILILSLFLLLLLLIFPSNYPDFAPTIDKKESQRGTCLLLCIEKILYGHWMGEDFPIQNCRPNSTKAILQRHVRAFMHFSKSGATLII